MAINKNALIRYQVLDSCFRNPGRMYFFEDLLKECNNAILELNPNSNGIQKRQLFEDIRFMESEKGWSIPLERYKYSRRVYYRYSDRSFSINNQTLNESEIEYLKSALNIITRFSGAPQFGWLDEIIPMLESKFGLIEKKTEVISFQSNVDLRGLHYLTPLFNAIIHERVLKISYQNFQSPEPYEVIFHPYYLKQYNNRWFVLGQNAENQNPNWNLALDRIHDLAETDLKYTPSTTDWEEYFYDLIGVTHPEGGELQEIILHFLPDIADYIRTKPIHPSQKYKYISSNLEVKIKVIPNFELEQTILSFGEKVKVIAPQDFQNRIIERLRLANQNYL